MATSIPSCWIHFVFMSEQILNSIFSSIYLSLHYIYPLSRFIENICSTTKSSSYIFHITGSVATYENGMYIPLNGTVCVNLVYFIKLAYIRFVNAKLHSSPLSLLCTFCIAFSIFLFFMCLCIPLDFVVVVLRWFPAGTHFNRRLP